MNNAVGAAKLREAANIIEKRGLLKRNAGLVGQMRCTLGAIEEVCTRTINGVTFLYSDLVREVHNYLDLPPYDLPMAVKATLRDRDPNMLVQCATVAEWNDRPEREAWEVIDMLRNCADKLEVRA